MDVGAVKAPLGHRTMKRRYALAPDCDHERRLWLATGVCLAGARPRPERADRGVASDGHPHPLSGGVLPRPHTNRPRAPSRRPALEPHGPDCPAAEVASASVMIQAAAE